MFRFPLVNGRKKPMIWDNLIIIIVLLDKELNEHCLSETIQIIRDTFWTLLSPMWQFSKIYLFYSLMCFALLNECALWRSILSVKPNRLLQKQKSQSLCDTFLTFSPFKHHVLFQWPLNIFVYWCVWQYETSQIPTFLWHKSGSLLKQGFDTFWV